MNLEALVELTKSVFTNKISDIYSRVSKEDLVASNTNYNLIFDSTGQLIAIPERES
jgi:hypothetical protein